MQYDSLRAFPHPVLRPDVNDYVEGAIQTSTALLSNKDGSKIIADFVTTVSVPELVYLIEKQVAEYAVLLACRDTYYRKLIRSFKPEFSCNLDATYIRGDVTISSFVLATQPIAKYVSPYINEEFGPGPFAFKKGAVLAIDEPQKYFIDRDSMKPISSIFVLVPDTTLGDHEWGIDSSNDKIHLKTSPHLKVSIDLARNNREYSAILANSIYFAAVMQCLSLLKSDLDYDSYRWAGIMRQACANAEISLDSEDESSIAQKLMKYPVALIDSYFFRAGQE